MHQSKRQRKKTFTGCWTCRSRRVKCDEQTPCCQRCRLFGVDCEGYGIRLTWLVGDGDDQGHLDTDENMTDVSTPRPKRNMRTFDRPELYLTPSWSALELDAMLERIDDCPVDSSRTESGVFSVFPVRTALSRSGDHTARELIGEESAGQRVPISFPGYHQSDSISSPLIGSRSGGVGRGSPKDLIDTFPAQQPKPSPTDIVLNSVTDHQYVRTADSPAVHDLELIHDDNGMARAQINAPVSTYAPQSLSQRPSRHLDLLQIPASQKRLIHHWITFTSSKLVLVDEPHNPCRTMMLPMALRGILSSLNESTADVSIFHAICACAAYNLFELGGRRVDEDRDLAWTHDQQAIRHLRQNLVQGDQQHSQSIAMAIMACITIEAISGNTGRWRTHLDGGLAYLVEQRKTVTDQDGPNAFQVHLVSMAILCGYQIPAELKSFLHDAEDMELSFPYYGVSQSVLRNLDHMNTTLASACAPESAELDIFELQLYLGFPPTTANSKPGANSAILHCMAQCFYYACLVFYQRCIRRVPIDEVQVLVEKGLMQLEAIETESRGSTGSVMMWAPLVLGAECNDPGLKIRVKNWFQRKKGLGFRNLTVLKDMISIIWARRADGEAEINWQDLISQETFDVFRL
ncbi:hypothetical protein JX266_009351 [Neoarthrinium moseri]|nr:hypothetical protein JX266_009351 [Neoarthrinium moseri]